MRISLSRFHLKFLIFTLLFFLPASSFAQPATVKKASQGVFILTTYNADGTIHATSHGALVGPAGEAIAMWHIFKGASRAVVIDAKGKQYDVVAMLGVSELYDICKFRIKDFTNAAAQLSNVAVDQAAATAYVVGYDIKKPSFKSIKPSKTEKFMTNLNYYVFSDTDIEGTDLGCPIVNDLGQLIGIVQRPENGGQAFSTDARVTDSFTLTGFSINDAAYKATGIRTALPADENQASLMLLMAAGMADSAKYEAYVDDYIQQFPTSTEGYNARANRLVAQGRLADADAMLQTEVKKADKKDIAYSNYASLVYQSVIYRVDTTYTKWSLQRALELAREAEKVNPQPGYKHQQAQILYSQKEYQQALDLFTELQTTELAQTGEVFYEAAQCKTHLKAPDAEIMALLDSAVSVSNGAVSAPYVLARGRVYDNKGEYRKAFVDYMTYDSLMNHRANSDFYYVKYQCGMKLRQYQVALQDIAHAIVLTRTEPLYYAEMASLQLRVNQVEDAIKTCDMALRLKASESYSDLYIIRGIAQCETKKKAEGLADLKKAQELGDSRAEGLIAKYSK